MASRIFSLFTAVIVLIPGNLLLAGGCGAQEHDTTQSEPADTRDERWLQDLEYLITELPLRHIDMFFQLSRLEWEEAAYRLELAIPTMTDEDILFELSKLVAGIGDAHTGLRLNNLKEDLEFNFYPITVLWFDDGLYVVMSSEEYSYALRSRVIGIGDSGIDQIYNEVSRMIPHENEAQLRNMSPWYFINAEALDYLGFSEDEHSATFIIENELGDTLSLDLFSVNPDERINWTYAFDTSSGNVPLYRQHPEMYYWYTYLDETQTLYFQYNACAMMQLSFNDFADELLEFIDSHPVERFVIDMRNNSGGNSMIAENMIAEIGNRPDINKPGHLFVVIGRRTFSSAVLNAIRLRDNTNSILIGEPTGGRPNHYGEVRTLQLPNSEIEVSYSTNYFTYSEVDSPSLIPDVIVELSSDDYFKGLDPILETILSYSNE